MTALIGFALLGCQTVKLPVVMKENPSLTELTQAVNANSSKIQSLRSDNATLGISNVSGWANCQIAFQRPQNVRLIGTASMMGRVVDFGANGEKFWFWSKYQNPEQILWAPINEYASSPMKETIPVDPVWFPEALGVVEINPSDVLEGPVVQADKTLLLVTQRQRPDGVYKKYTYVEPKTAAVKRQDVIGPTGETVVSVLCNEFQVDQATGAVLPKRLTVTCPKAQGSVQLNLGTPQLNPTDTVYAQLFQMPTTEEVGGTPVQIGSSTIPAVGPAAPVQQNAPTVAPRVAPQVAPQSAPQSAPQAATPPMVAPPAVASAAPQTTVPSSGPGSGAARFDSPTATGVNIPLAGTAGAGSTDAVATAEFRTIAVSDGGQSTNRSQSYMAPPIN